MKRPIYNFGAGPAMLPQSILIEAQAELLDWQHQGLSILEVGHRTPEFIALLEHAKQSLRDLLSIPANYQILFLGGAARTQFAMIPMNFISPKEQAGYIISGIWSKMAFLEAKHLKKAYCISSEVEDNFTSLPDLSKLNSKNNTSYLYYTPNETVNGIRFPHIPNTFGLPLIADMTSCLLSEPIDVSQYGLIFAGAQKNIANAGLTVVIVRDDLLEKMPNPSIPSMMHYAVQAQYQSLYATPPVFNCYLADKMFDWIKSQGGVIALSRKNSEKAAKLYQFIDASAFYTTRVDKEARSLMNVCFDLKRPELNNEFINLASTRGLLALNGHRLTGGLRASLYNAMPMEGVDALIHFMTEFEGKYIQ
jgi:phosphoserine aminotransferase